MKRAAATIVIMAFALLVWWSRESDRTRAPRRDCGASTDWEQVGVAPTAETELSSARIESAPPAPPQQSSQECTLRLALLDHETGEEVASRVHLYRLDLSVGEKLCDTLKRSIDVKRGGVDIEALPAGRYRFRAEVQRRGATDGPAFEVRGERTVVTRALKMPRRIRYILNLIDAEGNPVRQGVLQSSGYVKLHIDTPPWVRAVPLSNPFAGKVLPPPGRGRQGTRWSEGRAVTAGADGFDLGERIEDTDGAAKASRWRWSAPGWTSVQASEGHRWGLGPPHRLVAVTMRAEPLLASIRLPDGRRADDAGAQITMASNALDRYRIVTGRKRRQVFVTVRLDGFQTLEFVHDIGEPIPRRTLALLDE